MVIISGAYCTSKLSAQVTEKNFGSLSRQLKKGRLFALEILQCYKKAFTQADRALGVKQFLYFTNMVLKLTSMLSNFKEQIKNKLG